MPEPQDNPQSHSAGAGESKPAFPISILDGIEDGLVILDREWRYTYVNTRAARILGRPRSELLGKCVWDLFPLIVGTDIERQIRRAADEQVTCKFQGHDASEERFYENRAFPTPDGGVAVYLRDVTERRQHERHVERARAYAESIVTTVREPLLVLDRDLRVVSANRSFYATFEVGPAETEGRAVYDLGDGQWDIPMLRKLLEEIIPANHWFDDFEVEHDFGQIGRKTMLLNARRFPPEGPYELLLLAIEDITSRKQVAAASRESEERVTRILESITDGMVTFDPEWRFTYINGQAERALGRSGAELLGKFVWEEYPANVGTDVERQLRRAAAEKVTCGYEGYERVQDRWYDNRVFPMPDASIAVYFRDVTDRKRAEEALRESEGRFRLALSSSPNIVVFNQDRGLRYTWVYNPHVGFTVEEVLGKTDAELLNPEDAARLTAIKQGVLSSGVRSRQEVTITRGETRIYDLAAEPLRDLGGQVVGITCVAVDITDRKRSEEALRRAKEAAEAASRSKDEFLANVSHEIRTPFGAILGMTELVLDTPLTDDQRQCLETVRSAADSLLGLVEELLDFEKIEAGKLELVPADFSLRSMMADALRVLTARARMKGLELACNVEPDVPDALVGDAGRLRQVLTNLVGNAIKFTRHGEVTVRVGVAESPTPVEEVVLCFIVRDTGIGIAPDGRERIFRAFEQADSSTTREFGGTGLGLTIAARLVGLMGGEIGVESEPGRGSTFAFTARFGRRPHSPEPVVARPSDVRHEATMPAATVAPLRILVAEDNEFNVRHLQRLLGKRGHQVRLASNGREALALLGIEGQGQGVESSPIPAIDLLLLDLHMPEFDGFQVIRAIRERERAAGGHLPVIALTARSRPEDRDRCLAAGMDHYLSKPVRAAELLEAIERMISVHRDSRAAAEDSMSRLDPVVLLAACGDDAEGLRELCRDFMAFAPARISEVHDALLAGDGPGLREAAHKLCGVVSAFSAAAATAAADLEAVAARGELDEARPLVERLEMMARELILALEGLSLETLRRLAATAGS